MGPIVTIDTATFQESITHKIREAKGKYLIALQRNNKRFSI